MFLAIDRFLLERVFEPTAHWFERHTGRTHFYLVWWACGFDVFFLIMELGLRVTKTHDLGILDMIFGPMLLLGLSVVMAEARSEDDKLRLRPWREAPNFSGEMSFAWRLVLFFSALFELTKVVSQFPGFLVALADAAYLENVFWALQLSCTSVALYLLFVRRPPPDWSEQKEQDPKLAPIPAKN